MAQARAFLGNEQAGVDFRFNPYSVKWGYRSSAASRDTKGGRVVQLLSVRVEGMEVRGVAGSRRELQRFAEGVFDVMEWQTRFQQAVGFRVPSRGWDFRVYAEAVPQVGWRVATVEYPFSLSLKVDEDLGVATEDLLAGELVELVDGIGFNPHFHGGSAEALAELESMISAGAAGPGAASSGPGSATDTSAGGGWNSLKDPLPPGVRGGDAAQNIELGKVLAGRVGWGPPGNEWQSLYKLWSAESGWRTNADNPSSSAYGIPQALPGEKMASAGADWKTNPATQIRWGLGYIRDRPDYGTPSKAWAHFQRVGWY